MGKATIKSGTKLNIKLESKLNDTSFILKSTFEKSVDEASFLISAPMKNGGIFEIDSQDKLYIDYGNGDSHFMLEGYVDDYVKQGPRTYLKVRKTSTVSAFEQRADLRIKAQLKVKVEKTYWTVDGIDSKDQSQGLTMDISNGGVALYLNTTLGAGEVIELKLPKIKGAQELSVRGETCWIRETERGNAYKYLVGLKFFLTYGIESDNVSKYVNAVSQLK